MERPAVKNPISDIILNEYESGKISSEEAKLQIPNDEKIAVIEYICCMDEDEIGKN